VSKATAVLFGIEDEFDVLSVDRLGPDQVKILVEMRAVEPACRTCGVITRRVKDRALRRIKDLPACDQQTQLWWRKRRLACLEALCPRRSFTHPSVAVRPRARVTERLGTQDRGGDRGRKAGRIGGGRVRRVLADHAPGVGDGRHAVAARADTRFPVGDRRDPLPVGPRAAHAIT
jgi:hypothetical protein